jgi:predicted phage terminase large subunit-like protein
VNLSDFPENFDFSALSKAQKVELLELLEERERRATLTAAQTQFLPFVRSVYPNFKEGPHHRVFARTFEAIMRGEKKRVIINIAPRHSKSESSSYLFPSFYLGQFPDKKIIMASHTASLAEDFGRRVRNLIQSEEYARIFPETVVQHDQKAAGKWATDKKGEYYAVGVGGALAGRGADLLLIDDPHSEQDVRTNSKATFDSAWAWYQTGPMQRLMPNGAIIIVMTRWATDDLTGRLLEQAKTGGEEWEVIELPAILPSGRALWPEFWPVEELLAKKANMDPRYWASQYLQNPTDEEGALIKREYWRIWDKDKPPKCHYIIQSWDTAFSKNETADFSACTTWGVFARDDEKTGQPTNNIILLDAFKDRMQFPELKAVAVKHWRQWKPDSFIVEAKAAGQPLIYELRAQGIPVQEFTPSRGNDKTVRVNSVTDLFASGMVWRPDQRWAEAVAEECAQFPNGKHDDYVDTTTQALLRFRRGGLIKLPSDYKDDAPKPWRRKTAPYGWRARRV